VATTLSLRQGTELASYLGPTWMLTSTVYEEVMSGFTAGLVDGSLDDATSWSLELSTGFAFRVRGPPARGGGQKNLQGLQVATTKLFSSLQDSKKAKF
jgi:hypothetical protein